MRVALINTNTYTYPPTIPVGMEYLIAPLKRAGYEVICLDLVFCSNPENDVCKFMEEHRPEFACFSIRNTDTALFINNQFLLETPAAIVRKVKESFGVPAIVGGSATLCAGSEIARLTGADALIRGPAEVALPKLLERMKKGRVPESPIDGYSYGIIPDIVHERGTHIDYSQYLTKGHPAGIEFRKGCDWSCPFCVERSRPILSRTIEATVSEIKSLADSGVRSLFFCDSEFNIDTHNTSLLLEAIKREGFPTEITGYFRPVPMNGLMMKFLRESGFRKITLSVNSWDLSPENSPYKENDVVNFIKMARQEGIRVAVDLLVGYPGETIDSVLKALEILRIAEPDTVGVNPYIRIYEGTPAVRDALKYAGQGDGKVLGEVEGNPELVRPVFYLGINLSKLKDAIDKDSTFVLEGSSKTVNYERI